MIKNFHFPTVPSSKSAPVHSAKTRSNSAHPRLDRSTATEPSSTRSPFVPAAVDGRLKPKELQQHPIWFLGSWDPIGGSETLGPGWLKRTRSRFRGWIGWGNRLSLRTGGGFDDELRPLGPKRVLRGSWEERYNKFDFKLYCNCSSSDFNFKTYSTISDT